jgi:hypothetical protein
MVISCALTMIIEAQQNDVQRGNRMNDLSSLQASPPVVSGSIGQFLKIFYFYFHWMSVLKQVSRHLIK